MTTLAFIEEFKALHEKAKKGSLTPAEKTRYLDARAQFGRLVMLSQQLGHSGQTLRSNLRMSKMMKVEVRPESGEPTKTSTIDLSSGGFAVLMSGGMSVGKKAAFTLHLPAMGGGSASVAISGECQVASSRAQTSLFRVSFKFAPLGPDDQERLEMALIDAVLERLRDL